MVHVEGPVGLDGVVVAFDDERAVVDARIVLTATLASRLGIEALVDEQRVGASNSRAGFGALSGGTGTHQGPRRGVTSPPAESVPRRCQRPSLWREGNSWPAAGRRRSTASSA